MDRKLTMTKEPANKVGSPSLALSTDLLPKLSPFIRRVCSSFAPDGGVLRTQLV